MLAIAPLTARIVTAENAVTSQLGFHPNSWKEIVSYTSQSSGTFQIKDANTNAVVFAGGLVPAKDSSGNNVNCQGNQQCLVGDFTQFSSPGDYYITTGLGGATQKFSISPSVYSSTVPLIMEFFNAALQQGSSYHANLHQGQNPKFPMMADGSFLMEAQMATLPLIRLGSAYRRKPVIFGDKYSILGSGMPDIKEYIRMYVDYIEELQDFTGTKEIARGWSYNFQCPGSSTATPSQPRWNTESDYCMTFLTDKTSMFITSAFLAYMEAYPALDSGKQQEVLQRAISTYNHISQNYVFGVQDESAYIGAGLFLLYDYTGNSQYLNAAYNLRTKAPTNLIPEQTFGREFYWEEYARHKNAIQNAGLSYLFNGADPAQFFAQHVQADWSGISKTGEKVFQFNNNIPFQNSRFMLTEALFGAKAADLAGLQLGKDIAQQQISFLTGMNQIQDGTGAGPLTSKSFIHGIGKNPKNFHSRLVPPDFVSQGTSFNNGLKYIPGWVSGVFDSNGDGIFNHYDDWWDWRFTETTNEIVAGGVELFVYLDVIYNGNSQVSTPPPTSQSSGTGGSTSTGGSTYTNVQNIPATCSGGTINSDTFNGGRTITCTSGSSSLTISGWDKPGFSNAQYFEMYKQSQVGSGLKVCLLDTCIGDNGFARSPNYPLTASSSGSPTTTQTQTSTGTKYTNVQNIPSKCNGGTITSDTFNGGRRITCANGANNLAITAWDKPSFSNAQYFEMYKQSQSGSGLQICLGTTCISNNGFAKSPSYPITT